MPESLLTIVQVSQILGRSIPSLNRDLRDGRLPSITLGRSRRFRAEDIDRIAREGYSASPNAERA
jgi:excisionase family DNA binding protein